MRLALREASKALEHDDVPIGAVVVKESEVVGAGGNERELRGDATAHAEILAIREAGRKLGGWRLPGCVLYVTIEPCAMCASATIWARMSRVIFGARDPKTGAAGSIVDLYSEKQLNHHTEVVGGLLAEECASLLQSSLATGDS